MNQLKKLAVPCTSSSLSLRAEGLNPEPSQKGFSLVEILVAMVIIAVIAAVAIPNLNKFNSDQQVRNTSSQVVTDLRKIQNNAHSGVKCPNSNSAVGWRVVINTSNYILRCLDSTQTSSVLETVNITGSTLQISCPANLTNPNYVEFIKNTVTDECTITVQTSGSTDQIITISKGGAIY